MFNQTAGDANRLIPSHYFQIAILFPFKSSSTEYIIEQMRQDHLGTPSNSRIECNFCRWELYLLMSSLAWAVARWDLHVDPWKEADRRPKSSKPEISESDWRLTPTVYIYRPVLGFMFASSDVLWLPSLQSDRWINRMALPHGQRSTALPVTVRVVRLWNRTTQMPTASRQIAHEAATSCWIGHVPA